MQIKVGQIEYNVERYPAVCPICNHAIHPHLIGAVSTTVGQSSRDYSIGAFFQCPQGECRRGFVATYRGTFRPGVGVSTLSLVSTAPKEPIAPAIEPSIGKVSAKFQLIYTQAAKAEQLRLDQIAGCGYRRSLEFLVKDYCSTLEPELADTIQSKRLANVIAEHIQDPLIKQCATRATWLGNDETHYVRTWQDKDLSDLKTLIQLTMNWIHSSLLSQEYLKSMPGK